MSITLNETKKYNILSYLPIYVSIRVDFGKLIAHKARKLNSTRKIWNSRRLCPLLTRAVLQQAMLARPYSKGLHPFQASLDILSCPLLVCSLLHFLVSDWRFIFFSVLNSLLFPPPHTHKEFFFRGHFRTKPHFKRHATELAAYYWSFSFYRNSWKQKLRSTAASTADYFKPCR